MRSDSPSLFPQEENTKTATAPPFYFYFARSGALTSPSTTGRRGRHSKWLQRCHFTFTLCGLVPSPRPLPRGEGENTQNGYNVAILRLPYAVWCPHPALSHGEREKTLKMATTLPFYFYLVRSGALTPPSHTGRGGKSPAVRNRTVKSSLSLGKREKGHLRARFVGKRSAGLNSCAERFPLP